MNVEIGARRPGSIGRWARDASTDWVMVISCMAKGEVAEEIQLVDGLGLMQQLGTILAVDFSLRPPHPAVHRPRHSTDEQES